MWQTGNPLYYWGLLGLAIPILIHLYNRRKSKVKILGSLRWLSEVQPAQWHFKRIHQWPLLFIRLLLLVTAVLLAVDLQKMISPPPPDEIPHLILVHPEAGDSAQYRQMAAGLESDSVKVLWLQPSLSPVNEQIENSNSFSAVWSSIAEADHRFHPNSIHVIAPNRLDLLGGRALPVNAAVSWELTDVNKDTVLLMSARAINDTHELLWFQSGAKKTAFWIQKNLNDLQNGVPQTLINIKLAQVNDPAQPYSVPVTNQDSLKVFVDFPPDRENEWTLLKNSLKTLADVHNLPLSWVDAVTEADWYFNFVPNSILGKFENQALLNFYYLPDQSLHWLEPVYHNSIVIRRELTTGNILEGGLFEALRPYFLRQKHKDLHHPEVDLRNTEMKEVPSGSYPYRLASAGDQPSQGFRLWMGIVLLVLIVIERLWPKGIK